MSNNSASFSCPSGSKGNQAAPSRLGSVIRRCQYQGAQINGERRSRVPGLHLKHLFCSFIFPSFCPASNLPVHPSIHTHWLLLGHPVPDFPCQLPCSRQPTKPFKFHIYPLLLSLCFPSHPKQVSEKSMGFTAAGDFVCSCGLYTFMKRT